MTEHVLVIEDDASLAAVIRMTLRDKGYAVELVANGLAAADRLAKDEVDLALLDLNLPGRSGLDIMKERTGAALRPAYVTMTAYATIEGAVEAMKLGAADYLVKPFSMAELTIVVERVLECRRLKTENEGLKRNLVESALAGLVGDSPPFRKALETLRRAADTEATVLIQGETGTGKELAARAIHALSQRAAGPFVAVNCAAVPEALIESELFGCVKGAFTGADVDRAGKCERAQGGTLFLDEIAEMPAPSQAKLLRFLQEREIERVGATRPIRVDVRVVAATNRDLREEMEAGRLREDLFYRVAVLELVLPPLRERLDDLPLLVAHVLRKLGRSDVKVSEDALAALRAHRWRGNVRELQHAVQRAVVLLGDGNEISLGLLPLDIRSGCRPAMSFRLPFDGVVMEELERSLIEQALERTGGNRTKASQLLGLTRSALLYRVEKYRLGSESGASSELRTRGPAPTQAD